MGQMAETEVMASWNGDQSEFYIKISGIPTGISLPEANLCVLMSLDGVIEDFAQKCVDMGDERFTAKQIMAMMMKDFRIRLGTVRTERG